jgi:hypothetical protein
MDGLNKLVLKQVEWAVFGKIADYVNLFMLKNLLIADFFLPKVLNILKINSFFK